MILSDKTIKEFLQRGELHIEPLDVKDIQPASVDLHLNGDLKKMSGEAVLLDDGVYELKPQEFILGSTNEFVGIPNNLVGIVDGRSSIGRLGILVHITAGYIDPGFRGNITLEIYNVSSHSFYLEKDMSICQLILQTLTSECEHPYGSGELGSKYQDSKGTIVSRL